MKGTIKEIVDKGYCVGCGACASTKIKQYNMKFQDDGVYLPLKVENSLSDSLSEVCPFSNLSRNEDEIATELYSSRNANYDPHIGYSLACYAGYVKDGLFRKQGSSGGLVTWLAAKLLEENFVEHVIHVKPSNNNSEKLFEYGISSTIDELQTGAKSKYYPVEISQVMNYVCKNDSRYAFVGLPCFVKAVRLLARKDSRIRERIRFTIGLFCGHLKTDRFAKAMAWEMGIPPKSISGFDFRVKTSDKPASQYQVKASGQIDGYLVEKQAFAKDLFVSNWGYGFFKLEACDYCDDVVGETADVSVGDAWLSEYVNDPAGNNVVVVRDPTLRNLILTHQRELSIDSITAERVYQSQAGGFRHRRQGLAHRLFLAQQANRWHPKKRVEARKSKFPVRRKIYEYRIRLREESCASFKKAEESNDFMVFVRQMKPFICEYDNLNRPRGLALLVKLSKLIITRLFRQFRKFRGQFALN